MGWYGLERYLCTRNETFHVRHEIAVLVYKEWVLVVFVASPYLSNLSSLHFPLGIEGVTHHHHVGGLGEIVFALRFVAAVEVLPEAIEELIRDVSFNLQTQLTVDKRPLPRAVMFGGACCCGEVEVEVKGVGLLFQFQHPFGNRRRVVVFAAHTRVVSLRQSR